MPNKSVLELKTLNDKVELIEADKEWFPETFAFVCDLFISFCDGKIQNVSKLFDYIR